jgi:hypothetical protein
MAVQVLVVVRADCLDVYHNLTVAFRDTPVTVFMDRRRAERRRARRSVPVERRRGERRAPPAPTWRSLGYLVSGAHDPSAEAIG